MYYKNIRIIKTFIFLILSSFIWISCVSKPVQTKSISDIQTDLIETENDISIEINNDNPEISQNDKNDSQSQTQNQKNQNDKINNDNTYDIKKVVPEISQHSTINLLFAGDVMAHTENYHISDFAKIWKDVKTTISDADLAFANIESPIDTTKAESSYPTFNMSEKYVRAVLDAGFDAFSLCNNHTNDQGLNGILETMKTTDRLVAEAESKSEKIYFSGLRQKNAAYTYNLIEKNGWKILFLPITELLNSPRHSEYVNFVSPGKESRKKFIDYCKKLREENECDIFILSVHTSEPEYTRAITEAQNSFYMNLLDAGVDILWANHAHIIKDRQFIFNTKNQTEKLIMYANGNTISGQRRAPALSSSNPNGERDNTGDGLLYSLTLEKENGKIKIANAKPIFITTYINTANEYVIKKLDDEFVAYLEDVGRKDWAQYIRRRIKITNSETRDLILWQ